MDGRTDSDSFGSAYTHRRTYTHAFNTFNGIKLGGDPFQVADTFTPDLPPPTSQTSIRNTQSNELRGVFSFEGLTR